MSHYHLRKEKDCLNCGAILHGRYCHVCGQENIEPKETAWGLISHFLYDITHFDGKFFSTVKFLILKPGFLSKEFTRGRRASYLHPIRMYVFTSAFFFIVFFSMFHLKDTGPAIISDTTKTVVDSVDKNLVAETQMALKEAKTRQDSAEIERVFKNFFKAPARQKDTANRELSNAGFVNFTNTGLRTVKQYDSLQERLPPKQRDGWVSRTFTRKLLEIQENVKSNRGDFFKDWLYKFMHMLPQLLFVSLPIFAFLLKLLYIRRKNFFYGDHAIFSIHLYIFTFVGLLICFSLSKIHGALHWNWLTFISIAFIFYMFYYTYKAMRNFYSQGAFKTFIKYCLLNLMSFIVVLFLFVVFFFLSIFQL